MARQFDTQVKSQWAPIFIGSIGNLDLYKYRFQILQGGKPINYLPHSLMFEGMDNKGVKHGPVLLDTSGEHEEENSANGIFSFVFPRDCGDNPGRWSWAQFTYTTIEGWTVDPNEGAKIPVVLDDDNNDVVDQGLPAVGTTPILKANNVIRFDLRTIRDFEFTDARNTPLGGVQAGFDSEGHQVNHQVTYADNTYTLEYRHLIDNLKIMYEALADVKLAELDRIESPTHFNFFDLEVGMNLRDAIVDVDTHTIKNNEVVNLTITYSVDGSTPHTSNIVFNVDGRPDEILMMNSADEADVVIVYRDGHFDTSRFHFPDKDIIITDIENTSTPGATNPILDSVLITSKLLNPNIKGITALSLSLPTQVEDLEGELGFLYELSNAPTPQAILQYFKDYIENLFSGQENPALGTEIVNQLFPAPMFYWFMDINQKHEGSIVDTIENIPLSWFQNIRVAGSEDQPITIEDVDPTYNAEDNWDDRFNYTENQYVDFMMPTPVIDPDTGQEIIIPQKTQYLVWEYSSADPGFVNEHFCEWYQNMVIESSDREVFDEVFKNSTLNVDGLLTLDLVGGKYGANSDNQILSTNDIRVQFYDDGEGNIDYMKYFLTCANDGVFKVDYDITLNGANAYNKNRDTYKTFNLNLVAETPLYKQEPVYRLAIAQGTSYYHTLTFNEYGNGGEGGEGTYRVLAYENLQRTHYFDQSEIASTAIEATDMWGPATISGVDEDGHPYTITNWIEDHTYAIDSTTIETGLATDGTFVSRRIYSAGRYNNTIFLEEVNFSGSYYISLNAGDIVYFEKGGESSIMNGDIEINNLFIEEISTKALPEYQI
jgi:hypothetical protein